MGVVSDLIEQTELDGSFSYESKEISFKLDSNCNIVSLKIDKSVPLDKDDAAYLGCFFWAEILKRHNYDVSIVDNLIQDDDYVYELYAYEEEQVGYFFNPGFSPFQAFYLTRTYRHKHILAPSNLINITIDTCHAWIIVYRKTKPVKEITYEQYYHLLNAVAFLHDNNIVHNSITQQNLRLNHKGDIVLTGFNMGQKDGSQKNDIRDLGLLLLKKEDPRHDDDFDLDIKEIAELKSPFRKLIVEMLATSISIPRAIDKFNEIKALKEKVSPGSIYKPNCKITGKFLTVAAAYIDNFSPQLDALFYEEDHNIDIKELCYFFNNIYEHFTPAEQSLVIQASALLFGLHYGMALKSPRVSKDVYHCAAKMVKITKGHLFYYQ